MKLLENHCALITGSNRGIGKKTAEIFAENGCDLWLHARKETDEFVEFCQTLEQNYGIEVNPIYFDLTDFEAVGKGVKIIAKGSKSVDILINNAGKAFSGTLFMTPIDELKEVYEVNFYAPIYLMQQIGRLMMRRKSGSIVNVCSVGGIETQPGYLAYGSSKAALIWATKSVSKELVAYGIRVNAVAPGLTDTNMGYYKSEEELEKTIERTSMRRMGTPEEIANAILFLASPEASFVTGTVLNVDGGRGY